VGGVRGTIDGEDLVDTVEPACKDVLLVVI
jgi:hypothetical protein